MRKNILLFLLPVFLCIFLICSDYVLAAGNSKKDNDVYRVSIGSNFRAEPSQNGKWLMTLPAGVFVLVLEEVEGDYNKAQYGETEGYIYRGCLEKTEDCTYNNYKAQFPELFEDDEEEQEKKNNIRDYMNASVENNMTGASSVVAAKKEVLMESEVLALSNLRGTPSAEGEQLLLIPEGATVGVLDKGDNGYTHVEYDGNEGYIYTRCLALDARIIEASDNIVKTVVDGNNDSKGYTVTAQMDAPAALIRHSQAASASAAITQSEEGEESEEKKAPEAVKVEVNSSQQVKSTEAVSEVASMLATNVISKRTSLRSLPDQGSNQITTISAGTNVLLLGVTEGGYTMVQYDGVIGYVLENCVASSININQIGTGTAVYTVTAYCPCRRCCGNYSPEVRGGEPHTSTGTIPQEGRTIAVDPSIIPYGTKIYIEGYGTFVAEDCGGAIKGRHIDMYFDSHEKAKQFGSRKLQCTVVQ